ncbi:MAG: hypothetical protein E7298_02165 [Lachnospiraceae bacterium]|jgi:hypothetical protein|nr:hypothetical protein [Lachnospiraceae bacterium]MBQ6319570.1 hypothetical protein [Lachnospiraceae bacterium]MBQ8006465.1 hypothetical protein [Lachnospiraceae bacterium]MBQ8667812.1 hypothetical protein [Lachnospiraceae bacterium]
MKYIIGYDLGDSMSQISYFEINNSAPETVASDAEEERLGIPTVLSKRKGVAQWDFGNAAIRVSQNGTATLVDHLMSFAGAGAKIEIEGEAYDATDLLILFVRRSLNLLSMILSPSEVEYMIITVASLEGKLVDVVEKIAGAMPVDRDRIIIQTYEESIYYYLLHQPKDLWERDVTVFDYSGPYLRAYQLWMNKATEPVVAFVDRTDFNEIKMPKLMMKEEESVEKADRIDEMILQISHDYFSNKDVGTVFLLGEGFEGGWCNKTLKFMCMGKRVFQGRNMYSKGACYCGKDKAQPCELNKEYVFLGPDKLKFNLGLKMIVAGEEEYLAVADAGENWYDSGVTYDFVLGESKSVPLIMTPLDGKGVENIEIELSGLPDRPAKASRLRLTVSFESETRMKIEVEDLGFGEFFPSTGRKWEKIIEFR